MKLIIDRSSFLRPLGHVQSVVERRNTIPILANVLLKARNGKVQLTATDMDMNKDDPKLRSIWNTAVASSRYAGLTVENIIKVNGTQVRPIPTPCKTLVQATPK